MRRKLYPADKFPDGQADLAISLNNMGCVLQSVGRLEGALEHHQQALAMRRKLYSAVRFPDGHAYLAQSLGNLGMILDSLGRLQGAGASPASPSHAASSSRQTGSPKGMPNLALCLNNLGFVLHSMGRYEQGVPYLEQPWKCCA